MSNLELWNSFGRTDPQYTKAATVDGNRQTSIASHYMVKLATESLGPIGVNWGYSVVDDRFDETAPAMIRKPDQKELVMLTDREGFPIWELTHTLLLEMWHGSRENTFQQYGHTKYRYMVKKNSYLYVDHEYAKKSLTDAMKKCLSLLGVCNDIYLGEFDIPSYQELAQVENDIKKAANRDEEIDKKTSELKDMIDDRIKAISLCPTMEAVGRIYGQMAERINRESPILGLNPEIIKQPLDQAYFEQESKLKEAK